MRGTGGVQRRARSRARRACGRVCPGGAPPVSNIVDLRRDGDVAVVTVDSPPVNALKHAVRAGLNDALSWACDDAATRAIVLVGAGRTFIAGADIAEFVSRRRRRT